MMGTYKKAGFNGNIEPHKYRDFAHSEIIQHKISNLLSFTKQLHSQAHVSQQIEDKWDLGTKYTT